MVYRVFIYSGSNDPDDVASTSYLCVDCIVFLFEHGWYYSVHSTFPEPGSCEECRDAFGEAKGKPRQHEHTGAMILPSAMTSPESHLDH